MGHCGIWFKPPGPLLPAAHADAQAAWDWQPRPPQLPPLELREQFRQVSISSVSQSGPRGCHDSQPVCFFVFKPSTQRGCWLEVQRPADSYPVPLWFSLQAVPSLDGIAEWAWPLRVWPGRSEWGRVFSRNNASLGARRGLRAAIVERRDRERWTCLELHLPAAAVLTQVLPELEYSHGSYQELLPLLYFYWVTWGATTKSSGKQHPFGCTHPLPAVTATLCTSKLGAGQKCSQTWT